MAKTKRLKPIIDLRTRTQRGEPQRLIITRHESFIRLENRILTVSQGLVNLSIKHRVFKCFGKELHYCKQELLLSKEQYMTLVTLLNRTNPLLGLAECWF